MARRRRAARQGMLDDDGLRHLNVPAAQGAFLIFRSDTAVGELLADALDVVSAPLRHVEMIVLVVTERLCGTLPVEGRQCFGRRQGRNEHDGRSHRNTRFRA